MLCMSRNTVVSSYCELTGYSAIKVIKVLREHFQTNVAGFIPLSYTLRKDDQVLKKFITVNLMKLLIKEVSLFFKMEKVLLNCSCLFYRQL